MFTISSPLATIQLDIHMSELVIVKKKNFKKNHNSQNPKTQEHKSYGMVDVYNHLIYYHQSITYEQINIHILINN